MTKIIANYTPFSFDNYIYDFVDENIIEKMTDEDYENVEELYLDLKNVPQAFTTLKLHLCKSLKKLIISNALLNEVPLCIQQLEKLEGLCLINNFITEIPSWLCIMTNLREISFNNNLITSIPDDLYKLHNLERICFNSNKITTIPSCINKLEKMKYFTIYRNDIKDLSNILSDKLRSQILEQLSY